MTSVWGEAVNDVHYAGARRELTRPQIEALRSGNLYRLGK